MIKKKILNPDRVRRVQGGFSFVPHRFVTDGFLAALGQRQLLLYLFLVIVSDRYGLSFYGYDRICSLLELSLEEYVHTRDHLIEMDLIAFDGTIFQVLELPSTPCRGSKNVNRRQARNQAAITALLDQTLKSI